MSILIDYSKDKLPSQKNYTFADIKYPMTRDRINRHFEIITDLNAVDSAIHNIFDWMPGERILNPEFGNLLYKYISRHVNELTTKNIVSAVKRMFEWEPRAQLLEVDVTPNPDKNEYILKISYSIPVLDKTLETTVTVTPIRKIQD